MKSDYKIFEEWWSINYMRAGKMLSVKDWRELELGCIVSVYFGYWYEHIRK